MRNKASLIQGLLQAKRELGQTCAEPERVVRGLPPPPRSKGIRGSFRLLPVYRYPWNKSIGAAISMGLPILLGVALGHLSWGLLMNIGGFTAMYVHQESYRARAKKLLVVMLAIAFSFGLGSWAAVSPWTMALAIGGVSTVASFVCGALQMPPPGPSFFILACAIGTGLPVVDPTSALMRAGFALLGGCIAWLVAMRGWLFRPHGPALMALTKAYRDMAAFLAAIGTEEADSAQHNVAAALRSSERAVLSTKRDGRRGAEEADRLFLLQERVQALFLAAISLRTEASGPLSAKVCAAVRSLADTVDDPDRSASLVIPKPSLETPARLRLYQELLATANTAAGERTPADMELQETPRNVFSPFVGAFSKRSLVLPTALRLGITVIVAIVVAHLLGNTRPYWVPLTCAFLLQAGTGGAILQRTVQRAFGTAVGIFLAGFLLSLNPTPLQIALGVMVLQLVVELIIGRNYALAVVFITPLALIQVEAGNRGMPLDVLIHARLIDTMLGCLIGLVGGLFFWGRSSQVRLSTVLRAAIRDAGRLLHMSVSATEQTDRVTVLQQRHRLQTALLNLRVVYDHAINEFSRRHCELERLWPAVMATQRLGYLTIASSEHQEMKPLAPEDLTQLDRAFDQLTKATLHGEPPPPVTLPPILAHAGIGAEFHALLESLRIGEPFEGTPHTPERL